eukprot:7327454-Pyramimonas_sp.AAC.1
MGDDIDALDADELEHELLCLIGSGSASICSVIRLCKAINNNCSAIPEHVRQLASVTPDSHMERALHRWVDKQAWRCILPDLY